MPRAVSQLSRASKISTRIINANVLSDLKTSKASANRVWIFWGRKKLLRKTLSVWSVIYRGGLKLNGWGRVMREWLPAWAPQECSKCRSHLVELLFFRLLTRALTSPAVCWMCALLRLTLLERKCNRRSKDLANWIFRYEKPGKCYSRGHVIQGSVYNKNEKALSERSRISSVLRGKRSRRVVKRSRKVTRGKWGKLGSYNN